LTPRVLVQLPEAADLAAAVQPITLEARQRHYLTRVLRLADGAAVEAFDGKGRRWAAHLSGDRDNAQLLLDAPLEGTPESPLAIHLGQCLSSAEKMDWTVEKAVELGARQISPIFSQRSQVRLDAARALRKLEHWRAIAESACMQSGRDVIPQVAPAHHLGPWLAACAEPHRLVLDPGADMTLSRWARQSAPSPGSICLLVGPESGLAETELELALHAGFTAVRLGPRVLRTETAGLAAIAALQAVAGDF
jgi:16S rRNA (uracil1498-N3)-methyltransferase